MTIQSPLSPGSGLSTPRVRSVRDDTNSNCLNRKGLSSTSKALLTCDASAGKALIQAGPQPMVSRSSTRPLPIRHSSISSEARNSRGEAEPCMPCHGSTLPLSLGVPAWPLRGICAVCSQGQALCRPPLTPCMVELQNCLLRWSFSAPSGVDSAEGKCSLGFSWIVCLEGRCRRRRTQRRAQLSLQLDVFCDEDFLQHA